jgi:phosphoglycolate phosphatase
MTLKAPTIVIFDMDGTSVRHLNPVVLHIMERLDDAHFLVSKFLGWIFMRGRKGPILPPDETKKRAKRKKRLLVHRALHKIRRKPVEQIVEPCHGIFNVLDFLQSHGIPMAMVSNGLGKGYGHDILKKFDLDQYFDVTIFREDITRSKPNPEPLLIALRQLRRKVTAQDVIWYIGDRHKDVTAALAASKHLPCPVQPIAYGLNAAAAVIEKNVGTDHIIMNYNDMHKVLKTLLKNVPLPAKPPVGGHQNDNAPPSTPPKFIHS